MNHLLWAKIKVIKSADLIPANNFIFEDDAVNELTRIAKENILMLLIRQSQYFAPLVSNDLTIDKAMTDRFKDELIGSVSETRGMVRKAI